MAKKKKIIYNGKKYNETISLFYSSDEQIREWATLIFNNFLYANKDITEDDIEVNYEMLDARHGEFILSVKNGKNIKYLMTAYDEARYLTEEDIDRINLHSQRMFEENGTYGIEGKRDPGLIDRIVETTPNSTIFGQDRLPTILKKAAHYWWQFAHYQSYMNGNKRTGLLTVSIFLNVNGLNMRYNKDAMYDISKKIANNLMSEDELYEYLLVNTRIQFSELKKKYFSSKFINLIKEIEAEDEL